MSQLNKLQVRAAFNSAAQDYQQSAVVQAEIIQRVLAKLDFLEIDSSRIVDLGCGPGNIIPALRQRLPNAEYLGVDFALSMLAEGKKRTADDNSNWLCADIAQLPIASRSCDLVLSASTLQWSESVPNVFAESRRVLRDEGIFLFSTFGPDTLCELRASFKQVDPDGQHINQFEDMHTFGDWLFESGFEQVVMDVDRIRMLYQDPFQLMRDLKITGANNHLSTRSRGLFGAAKMKKVVAAYEAYRTKTGQYPATYEVIYGMGKASAKGAQRIASNTGEVPIHFIPGRSK